MLVFNIKSAFRLIVLLCIPAVTIAEDLTNQPQELPPISVTADPLESGLLEFGKPATVLNEDEIVSKSQSTLGQTLALEPGVRGSFFGPGSSRPIIRGFAGDRVRVLKNGLGSGDVSNISEDHVVTIDPMQAKKIEILRGPETLLYGSSAIGGAVNVIDDSIPDEAVGKPLTGTTVMQFGDSADNEKTFSARLKGQVENFNWYLSGFSRLTDDYEIPGSAESHTLLASEGEEESEQHGIVTNTDTETKAGIAGGSYIWDSGFIGIALSTFDSNYGIPGHSHAEHHDDHGDIRDDHSEENESVRVDSRQERIDMRGKVDLTNENIESVTFRAAFTQYEHKELEGDSIGSLFEKDTFESRVEVIHAPIGLFTGSAGVALQHEDFSASGEEAFIQPTKTWAPALFVFEETPLTGNSVLQFGSRFEYVQHDPEIGGTQEFIPFSISAGPVWDPLGDNRYTVGLTFAYTERAPSVIELFADGSHLSRQIFERGNTSLSKERSWGADLVLRKNRGIITAGFTPFYKGFENYINLSATGENADDLPVFAYDEVAAYFWGFEFDSTLDLNQLIDMGAHGLAFDAQFDYVRARDQDTNENIPRIAPFRSILRARYNYNEFFSTMIEGVFVEKQDTIASFELPTESYALLNSEASVALPFYEDNALSLFVRGSNLTNEEAREHASFLKDLAPLRGRAFLFGIKGAI